MPQIVGKSATKQSSSSGDIPIWKLALVITGVLLLLVGAALWGKKTLGNEVSDMPTRVAPLPGTPDTIPFNTKEWQDGFKSGKMSVPSGIPGVDIGELNKSKNPPSNPAPVP